MSIVEPKEAACPYCRKIMRGDTIPFGTSEQKCEHKKCQGKWHEGGFAVLCVKVVNREKRGLGKDRGVMWNIRYKTNGTEGALSFRTLDRKIQLKSKDILVLSIMKESKGLLGKKWTGKWEMKPTVLLNVNIASAWMI